MKKFALAFCLAAAIPAQADENHISPREYVPDQATAVAIARAVLVPILGEKAVRAEVVAAHREGDIWIVSGIVPCAGLGCLASGVVRLSAVDGKILFAGAWPSSNSAIHGLKSGRDGKTGQ